MRRDDLNLWALGAIVVILLLFGLGSCNEMGLLPNAPYDFDS